MREVIEDLIMLIAIGIGVIIICCMVSEWLS